MFRQNLQHTGRGNSTLLASNVRKWRYSTGGFVYSSPAIASDGTVYVGSQDSLLYALNPDGTLKWKYHTNERVGSSPAIATDGTIYVVSTDNYLYAINPDGTLKWKYQTGSTIFSSIYSSPTIASDGTVYVGSGDIFLYAINPDGTLKWKYQTGSAVQSSPAIASDGTIYVGSYDSFLYAINPNGTLKWKCQTGIISSSSPAIASDGTVYVGSTEQVSWSNDGRLYAINPDGTLKWYYQTGSHVQSSPAIATDGTVYVGSWDTYLYAINPDSTLKWKYQTDSAIYSSPAIASDGTVYVGSNDGYLYAINPDGTLKWKHLTIGNVQSSPAIASDGAVYFGGSNSIYALASLSQVTLTSPNGSESWTAGTSHNITWTSSGVTNVKLEYSTNNGSIWTTISTSTGAAAGSYIWMVPDTPSTQCTVRISDTSNSAVFYRNYSVFTIVSATISLISPNGGETWTAGSSRTITWTSNLINVKLEYSANNGTTWTTIVTSTGAAAGSYSWTVPGTPGTNYLVRVSNASDASVSDQSDAVFAVLATVTVTAPNGGESWAAGSTQNITWLSYGVENVKLQYSANNGSTWTTITASTGAAAGNYSWIVPGTPGTNCLVQVSDASNASVNDQSNAVFSILATMTVTAPNGGEQWTAGTIQTITWSSTAVDTVRIEYSPDGVNWSIVSSATVSSGSYSWSIPENYTTTSGMIRITDIKNDSITDTSNDIFSIINIPVAVSVSSPNGGEEWIVGTTQNITWTASRVSNVKLEYSANNASTWTTIIDSTDATVGSYAWTVPSENSSQCLVRTSDAGNATVSDVSNAVFTILPLTVTLTSPNGGERWVAGKTYPVTWLQQNVANLNLEYSTNSGISWNIITASVRIPITSGT